MNDETCVVCGEPFTPDEWDTRHSVLGGDVHDTCCDCEDMTEAVFASDFGDPAC